MSSLILIQHIVKGEPSINFHTATLSNVITLVKTNKTNTITSPGICLHFQMSKDLSEHRLKNVHCAKSGHSMLAMSVLSVGYPPKVKSLSSSSCGGNFQKPNGNVFAKFDRSCL